MSFRRNIFEYGIFAMILACILVFCLLILDILFFLIIKVSTYNPEEFFLALKVLLDKGNYLEVILILIWGLFFIGLFSVVASFLMQVFFNIIFRSNLLKDLPEKIDIDNERIAVVIPAYNEEDTLKQVILDCQKYAKHIVVINDGSRDKTPEILSEFSDIHVLTNKNNLGLGKTMKKGIEYATQLDIDVIVTFDADGQYRSSEIPKIASLVVNNDVDLVLGSRFAGKIEFMPFNKRIGNKLMSFALSFILGLKITDGQTGFRGISKDLALAYRLRGDFTYTQEMIMQARFMKKKIIEVPIFFDKRISGTSRLIRTPIDYAMRSWLTIIRTLRDYQPIWFFGGIGVISVLFGLFFFSLSIVSLTLPWAVRISNQSDVTLYSTILILVGLQFVFFGFLADSQRPEY